MGVSAACFSEAGNLSWDSGCPGFGLPRSQSLRLSVLSSRTESRTYLSSGLGHIAEHTPWRYNSNGYFCRRSGHLGVLSFKNNNITKQPNPNAN